MSDEGGDPVNAPWPIELPDARYVLRLYVTGSTPRSTSAISNIRRICEDHLKGRYDLEVVDVYQDPEAAREAQIIAAPTLIKKLPEPLRRMIGDLSDEDQVLAGLNISPRRDVPGGDCK